MNTNCISVVVWSHEHPLWWIVMQSQATTVFNTATIMGTLALSVCVFGQSLSNLMSTNCISLLGLAWTSSNSWVPGLPWSLTVFPFYGSLVHYLYPLDGQSWVPTVFEYLTSLCSLTVFQYMASTVHPLCSVLMCSYASTVFSTWLYMSTDWVHLSIKLKQLLCWILNQVWALTVFE